MAPSRTISPDLTSILFTSFYNHGEVGVEGGARGWKSLHTENSPCQIYTNVKELSIALGVKIQAFLGKDT